MLPLFTIMFAALMALTYASFRATPLNTRSNDAPLNVDWRQLALAGALYIPFLIAADRQHAFAGVAIVLAIYAIGQRAVLARVDWPLLAVFILMFIDLRMVSMSNVMQGLVARAGLAQPAHLFLTTVATSQIISNVPATILLHQFSRDWQFIAYGANVGGFGLAIGSLANLIALRQVQSPRAWLIFHAFSIPFLLLMIGLCYAYV